LTGCNNKKEKEAIKYIMTTPSNITIEMIDGKLLPQQKKLDDSSLLGIDLNNNEIRDDVEIKIFNHYTIPVHRAIMFQAARTKQRMLSNPYMIKQAKILEKISSEILGCIGYLTEYKKIPEINNIYKTLNKWQYNNKKRVEKYRDYDKALSGGVYSVPKSWSQYCQFDIEKVLNLSY
jgi:hypothetical protein